MSDATPQTPPHNFESEQALLGAIFLSNEAYQRVSDFLAPEHFFEALHGRIYEVAGKLIVDGRVCTPVSIKTFMPDIDLGGVSLAQYLVRLASHATTVINAADYGRVIFETAMRRQVIGIANQLANDAQALPVDHPPVRLIEEVTQALSDVAQSGRSHHKEPESLATVAQRVSTNAMQIRSGAKADNLIRTGIGSLDRVMGGIGPGNLVIIAGRPGMAKTGLAVQIAMNISKQMPVLYTSLEMSNDEISMRAMSNVAFISGRKIAMPYKDIREARNLSEIQVEEMVEAERDLRSYGLACHDQDGMTMEQIGFRAKMMASRLRVQGKRLGALVVDHMGLVKTPRHLKERVDQITFISGGLKQLAKNIDCPVIALSQLSRQVEYRDDKRPQLSDLRDSGSIEQDADSVLGVYREDYYVQKGMWKPPKGDEDIPPAPPYELEVRVLKNRHGSEGTVKLWCDMAHNVIQDMQL